MSRVLYRPACTMRRLSLCALWSSAAVLSVGCGSPEATVSGVVTLDDQPLSGGSVSFVPAFDGAGASAEIQTDGSYEARTANAEGLAAGRYRVAVRALGESTPDPRGGPPKPGKLLTPQRYARSTTSGIEVEVVAGDNDLPIKLSSAP